MNLNENFYQKQLLSAASVHNMRFIQYDEICHTLALFTCNSSGAFVKTPLIDCKLLSATAIELPVNSKSTRTIFRLHFLVNEKTKVLFINEDIQTSPKKLLAEFQRNGIIFPSTLPDNLLCKYLWDYISLHLEHIKGITIPGWHQIEGKTIFLFPEDITNGFVNMPLNHKSALSCTTYNIPDVLSELKKHLLNSAFLQIFVIRFTSILQTILHDYELGCNILINFILEEQNTLSEKKLLDFLSFYNNRNVYLLPLKQQELYNIIQNANDECLVFKIPSINLNQYETKLLYKNLETLKNENHRKISGSPYVQNHFIPIILSYGILEAMDSLCIFPITVDSKTIPYLNCDAKIVWDTMTYDFTICIEQNIDAFLLIFEDYKKRVLLHQDDMFSTFQYAEEAVLRILKKFIVIHSTNISFPELLLQRLKTRIHCAFKTARDSIGAMGISDQFITAFRKLVMNRKISVQSLDIPWQGATTALLDSKYLYMSHELFDQITSNVFSTLLPLVVLRDLAENQVIVVSQKDAPHLTQKIRVLESSVRTTWKRLIVFRLDKLNLSDGPILF